VFRHQGGEGSLRALPPKRGKKKKGEIVQKTKKKRPGTICFLGRPQKKKGGKELYQFKEKKKKRGTPRSCLFFVRQARKNKATVRKPSRVFLLSQLTGKKKKEERRELCSKKKKKKVPITNLRKKKKKGGRKKNQL